MDWYSRLYENAPYDSVKGDIAAGYFRSEIARKRISKVLPGRKMIIMVRNPIERLWSGYRFMIANGTFAGTFGQMISNGQLNRQRLDRGLYAQRIEEWRKDMGDENILVVFLDDVMNEPQRTYSRICNYLSISEEYTPKKLQEKINQPERVRSMVMRDIHLKMELFLSRNEFRLVKRIIRGIGLSNLLYSVNHARLTTEIIPINEFNTLKEYFLPEINRLEILFDRDLSHWYTGVKTR